MAKVKGKAKGGKKGGGVKRGDVKKSAENLDIGLKKYFNIVG